MIRVINGKGIFTFHYETKITVSSEFVLTQYCDSTILIEFKLKEQKDEIWQLRTSSLDALSKYNHINVSLDGFVNEPDGKIFASHLDIQEAKYHREECEFILDAFRKVEIKYNSYLRRKYTINVGLTNFDFHRFDVELEDFTINFKVIPGFKSIIEKLRKDTIIHLTSIAYFSYKKQMHANISNDIENLSRLISYAVRTDINCIFEEYFYKEELVKILLIPILSRRFVYRQFLIDPTMISRCKLSIFIEITYKHFKLQQNLFGLNMAMDYYLGSFETNISQNMFIFGFICLEVILDNFEELRNGLNPFVDTSS